MRLNYPSTLVLAIYLISCCWPSHAQIQDVNTARTKCVQFGFKENTKNHDECIKQFLKSAGSVSTSEKPTISSPKSAEPSSKIGESQKEEEYWKDAKNIGNRNAFEAYLSLYPNGRHAALAKANIALLDSTGVRPLTEKFPLKIAFAYVGPVGDGGWTFSHDIARQAVEKEFGDKIVTSFVENVPESDDSERVFRDMARQGNKIIFGTTFGYMNTMLKLSKEFPGVKFEHATGYKTAQNMRTYDVRSYEGAYLLGVIAGAMTKSNVIGVVASVPIPEVIRNINCFTLGAQLTNPKIKTKVVWVNEWYNPPKEAEAADSLINAGADILMQNTDSPAVLQTAQKRGKRAFGWDSDMTAYGPQAHLASAVNIWDPYYLKVVNDYLNGSWTTGGVWWGVKEGAIDLASIASDVPPEVKLKINQIKYGLRNSTYQIWRGPMVDNMGKILLNQGERANDKFLSGVFFYVAGVEGRVPGK